MPRWRVALGYAPALVGLAVLLASAGGTRPEVAWLRAGRPLGLETPELRVAVDASYPPLALVAPDGQLAGLEVDLARAIGAQLGVPVRLTNADVGGGLDALVAGKFDLVIAGLPYYAELTQDVAFSRPYLETGPVVVGGPSSPRLDDARSLVGRRLAVEPGSMAAEVLDRLAARGIRPARAAVFDPEQALELLASGSVDGYVVDRITALEIVAARPDLRLAGPPLESQPSVVAVRRPKRGLLLAVNRALRRLRADGELERLEARWLAGQDPAGGTLRATGEADGR